MRFKTTAILAIALIIAIAFSVPVLAGTTYLKNLNVTSTATTGAVATIDAHATLTTGKLLKLVADDDVLNGGLYLQCLGGASYDTQVFGIGESGNTAIAGTLAVTGNTTLGGTCGITGNTTVGGTCGITGNTTIAGTLAVTGSVTATIPVEPTVAETTASRIITSADYGKTILLSYAGAVTVTLPANGAAAGSWFRAIVIGSDSCAPTIAAATADTLIAPNDAAADSITFGTGHRIGAVVKFISTGTYWVAINEGSTTMTVNT